MVIVHDIFILANSKFWILAIRLIHEIAFYYTHSVSLVVVVFVGGGSGGGAAPYICVVIVV